MYSVATGEPSVSLASVCVPISLRMAYYANGAVRARIREFLALDAAGKSGGEAQLWGDLMRGVAMTRPPWNGNRVVVDLRLSYEAGRDEDFHTTRARLVQEPAAASVLSTLERHEISPLHLWTGAGHRFLWEAMLPPGDGLALMQSGLTSLGIEALRNVECPVQLELCSEAPEQAQRETVRLCIPDFARPGGALGIPVPFVLNETQGALFITVPCARARALPLNNLFQCAVWALHTTTLVPDHSSAFARLLSSLDRTGTARAPRPEARRMGARA